MKSLFPFHAASAKDAAETNHKYRVRTMKIVGVIGAGQMGVGIAALARALREQRGA